MDLVGDLERRRRILDLAAAVVGQVDGRSALLDGNQRVFDRRDALWDYGEGGTGFDLVV